VRGAATPPPPASGSADRVEEVSGPSTPPPARIGRPPAPPTHEDVLAELFERVGEVAGAERGEALDFLLDLALEKAGAEAGTIFLARLGSDDLEFAVTRGPRAKELLELGVRVPMGAGIVGFCAKEDVCLAISDAQQDPRFYRAVSEAIGYETRSILCAPIAREGRVYGALEVLNKRGGQAFGPDDLAIVAYLAHHAAGHLAG
jgi:GAF domain-containing protein